MTSDMAALRNDTTSGMAALRSDMTSGMAALRGGVAALRNDITSGMAALRRDMGGLAAQVAELADAQVVPRVRRELERCAGHAALIMYSHTNNLILYQQCTAVPHAARATGARPGFQCHCW